MRLGDFQIFALSDGSFALDGGQMFGVVPKPLWEKKMPADNRNRVRLGLNCLLVRTGQQNIVIETGIGDKFDDKFADIYDVNVSRRLPDQIRRHGLDLTQIHLVINSHLHFDHCGWNVTRWGCHLRPSFPVARYFVQRGEWEHALEPNERDRASYIDSYFRAAESQTTLLEGDHEIVPGIRVQVFPGHTRDLQVVWIESRGERACFISDLVPMSPHVPYPWIMAFDLYPMETLAGKKKLLPELVRDRVLVVFPHDDSMPWARLVEKDGKITAVAVEDR